MQKVKIALLCGGPWLERGISLNSARSVLDHLGGDQIEIVPIYFDLKRRAFRLSPAQLYSNTPSDFDFKLSRTGKELSEEQLVRLLKSMDLVFPAIHGPFGEDGEIQSLLERHQIPFVGSGSEACKKCFDKYRANTFISSHGFYAPPSALLKIYEKNHRQTINNFFKNYAIERAIVKPASGGSAIGVFSVSSPEEAVEKARLLFSKRMDTRVVIEPFARGIEFTTIVLQNCFALPVTILPTEIETDYSEHQVFDFRKKYLPTRHVTFHCPPRFSNEVLEKIQVQAEHLFSLFGMKDFARFDGWVLEDGNIWFSDFNPVSGMEQNSFLFQQASRIGMSHRDILHFIVKNAAMRHGISIPEKNSTGAEHAKKPISVLFGGNTSERQVSLMSGTNVWLKLRQSALYRPLPFLLDLENNLWELPYTYTLNHTVEEIVESCKNAKKAEERLGYLERKVRLRLALENNETSEPITLPQKLTFDEFIKRNSFIFNALHGGDGEDGTLQARLAHAGVKFNGPNEEISRLCMDKWITKEHIKGLKIPGVQTVPGILMSISEVKRDSSLPLWRKLRKDLHARTLVIKPRADGCSSGVVHLYTRRDLEKYIHLITQKVSHIPKNTFRGQWDIIEMPLEPVQDLLFEKFIETDVMRAKDNALKYARKSGWIEVTVGVVEEQKKLKVLNPSITIVEGEVLSVEEKFQGGTGINITPPPREIVRPAALKKFKQRIQELAEKLGITGYSRIDAFMQVDTGEAMIIEINTLPGLTPSTVFYHQALAENPPVYPRELLEKIIQAAGY